MQSPERNGHSELPPGGVQLCPEIVRYKLDGHRYLHLPTRTWLKGITKIIKNEPMDEGLIRYVANQGGYEQYLENLGKAALRGTIVHNSIEKLLNGETLDTDRLGLEEIKHLQSFVRLCANHVLDTRAIEEPVWDLERQIATCIDWRGLFDGKHTNINWKTSKAIYGSSRVQANEEAILFNSMGRFDDLGPIEQWAIARTNPNFPSKYQIERGEIDERMHQYFECLYDIEAYREEDWDPKFPPPIPKTISLPHLQNGETREPPRNGVHTRNGKRP